MEENRVKDIGPACQPHLVGDDSGDLPEPLWWWFQTQTRWRPQSDLGCQSAHTCTDERRPQDEHVVRLLPVLKQLLNSFEMMMMRRINQDDRSCPVPCGTPEQKRPPIRSERFPVFWVRTPDFYEWNVWAALVQTLKEQNCWMLEDDLFSLDGTKCVDTYWSNAPDDLTNLSTTGCNEWLKYRMSVFWLTLNISFQISESTNTESIVKWLKVSAVKLK